jgi:hypothetical protein
MDFADTRTRHTGCGWAQRTSSSIAGPGKVHALVLSTINAPIDLTCSARYARTFIYTPLRTPFSSSIKPAGMAPKTCTCQATSLSCRCRRVRPSSTAKKISGRPYVRFWMETEVARRHYETSEGCVGLADAEPHSQGTIHAGNQQSLYRSPLRARERQGDQGGGRGGVAKSLPVAACALLKSRRASCEARGGRG